MNKPDDRPIKDFEHKPYERSALHLIICPSLNVGVCFFITALNDLLVSAYSSTQSLVTKTLCDK